MRIRFDSECKHLFVNKPNYKYFIAIVLGLVCVGDIVFFLFCRDWIEWEAMRSSGNNMMTIWYYWLVAFEDALDNSWINNLKHMSLGIN